MGQNKILQNLENPMTLEALFRQDPEKFQYLFTEAAEKNSDSEVLKTWQARLDYQRAAPKHVAMLRVFMVVFLSLIALLLIKLPLIFPIEKTWFDARFESLIVIGVIIIYFLKFSTAPLNQKYLVIAGYVSCFLLMLFIPEVSQSSSLTMSKIHLPLVLLSLLGILYMDGEWKSPEARIKYIRFIAEVLVYTVLILFGGIILTTLTFNLFALLDFHLGWYDNVIAWGLVSAPLVATFVYDSILNRESRLATVFSNIFAPLVLITVTGYLLVMVYAQKNPFSDRESLITFNGLLVIVWGITVFSIVGQRTLNFSKIINIVNVVLVSVTVIINVIALVAITYRFVEFGITVNRIAVIGANLLMFFHLVKILMAYVAQYRQEYRKDLLIPVIANYLPFYSVWSVFVVFILPVIFQFK